MQASIGTYLSTYNFIPSDPDADTFFTAAGVTSITEKNAVYMLVHSAKLHGWWTLCNVIYLFMGNSDANHGLNLKNTSTFSITFSGTWTHNSLGSQGASTSPNFNDSFGDTGLTPSTHLSDANSTHISIYSCEDTLIHTDPFDIGVQDGSDKGLMISARNNSSAPNGGGNANSCMSKHYKTLNANAALGNTGSGRGHFITSKTSATDVTLYRDGTSVATRSDAGGSLATLPVYVGAIRLGAGAYGSSGRRIGFASIGSSLTSTQASQMASDVQCFIATLGR